LDRAEPLKVFFFGDSICFGQGVSPHRTWIHRIAQELHERFGGRFDVCVQNPSINGNTTRMALDRIAYDVQSHEPHVLYIQFGMNDCNGWKTDRGHPRVSRDSFAANLGEIVDRGRLFGARQVVLGTNHPTARLPSIEHTYDEANRAYNAIIRKVAETKGTMLADAERAFDAEITSGRACANELVLADRLHLSERGHDIYFHDRLPILVKAVEAAIATL
jgi:lysophospholipase L1-like esterase